jgi:hypothetical protein
LGLNTAFVTWQNADCTSAVESNSRKKNFFIDAGFGPIKDTEF